MKVVLKPNETAKLYVHYNPSKKGRTSCDVKFTIFENPYEYFTVNTNLVLIQLFL